MPCGAGATGAGAARPSRSQVAGLVRHWIRAASRAPAWPPRARPQALRCWTSRSVRRAHGAANARRRRPTAHQPRCVYTGCGPAWSARRRAGRGHRHGSRSRPACSERQQHRRATPPGTGSPYPGRSGKEECGLLSKRKRSSPYARASTGNTGHVPRRACGAGYQTMAGILWITVQYNRHSAVSSQDVASVYQRAMHHQKRGRPRMSWRSLLFRQRVRTMGIKEVKTAPRSPWQNPYVERLIGSIRRDCLNVCFRRARVNLDFPWPTVIRMQTTR